MIHLRTEDGFNVTMDQDSVYNARCNQEIYQPSYESSAIDNTKAESQRKIKSECPDVEEEIHVAIGSRDGTTLGLQAGT